MDKITNSQPPPLRRREQDLAGKVAVVTGGTRGIGRATTLHLASRGCKVLITSSSQPSLDEHLPPIRHAIQRICNEPTPDDFITGIVADIYSPDCASTIADGLNATHGALGRGKIDILILNAAAPYITDVGNLNVDEVSKSLLGNVQTNALIVDELVKRRYFRPNGRIVLISSVRGRMPWKRQLMYSAGKAAGEMMCKTWAESFGGKHEEFSFMAGTTANAVVTGLTATDAVLNMPPDILGEVKEEFLPHQDIPKFAVAEDIADAVGMLCGNDARWITGQSISVSGGLVKLP